MPRGGKREGAGRKPQLLRYDGKSIGRLAIKVGQRCEELWHKSYKTNFFGFHEIGEKRPRTRKRIIQQVADEFDLTPRMVERLWEDWRRVLVDTDPDNPDGD
jgi:hypothetical protein